MTVLAESSFKVYAAISSLCVRKFWYFFSAPPYNFFVSLLTVGDSCLVALGILKNAQNLPSEYKLASLVDFSNKYSGNYSVKASWSLRVMSNVSALQNWLGRVARRSDALKTGAYYETSNSRLFQNH